MGGIHFLFLGTNAQLFGKMSIALVIVNQTSPKVSLFAPLPYVKRHTRKKFPFCERGTLTTQTLPRNSI